jgi:hypothetical protein
MLARALLVFLTSLAVLADAMALPGCALNCGATTDKLANLRRGMNYDEVKQVMGCAGMAVTEYGPATADYASVEWNGPESMVFSRTRLDFLDGKLLSYTTERRGAL